MRDEMHCTAKCHPAGFSKLSLKQIVSGKCHHRSFMNGCEWLEFHNILVDSLGWRSLREQQTLCQR